MKKELKEIIVYILVIILIIVMGTEIGVLRNRLELYEDKLNEIDGIYQREINETIQTYEKLLEVCE